MASDAQSPRLVLASPEGNGVRHDRPQSGRVVGGDLPQDSHTHTTEERRTA